MSVSARIVESFNASYWPHTLLNVPPQSALDEAISPCLIQDLLVSIPGRDIDSSEWNTSWFSSASPVTCKDICRIRLYSFLSNPFQFNIHVYWPLWRHSLQPLWASENNLLKANGTWEVFPLNFCVRYIAMHVVQTYVMAAVTGTVLRRDKKGLRLTDQRDSMKMSKLTADGCF
jgi:hypothetical protein